MRKRAAGQNALRGKCAQTVYVCDFCTGVFMLTALGYLGNFVVMVLCGILASRKMPPVALKPHFS